MGYTDWYSETDSTAILGNIQDENPSQAIEGTVVNTEFLSTYIGQRLVDLAAVLGANPNHAANSIYRAGGRGGFPLVQIPSDSPEITNDTDNRYCQLEEDINDLFENSDLGSGDQILGTFTVRFAGSGFLGEWNGLTAYQLDNGKYSVLVDRTSPNRSFGTLPSFDAGGSDSSAFELSFESGSASGGAGLTGNVSVFGAAGSGAQYNDWQVMLDAIEPTLDSTNQHTVLVMPGQYNMDDLVWKARPHYKATGNLERYNQYKLYVPSYVHVAGLDDNSVVFSLDSTDMFARQGGIDNAADSTVAGGNPAVFLASQFSSINNMTIKVNQQIVSPDPRYAMPSPIRFLPDSSTPYLFDQTNAYTDDLLSESDIDNYEGGGLLHKWLFSCDKVNFEMTGWGNNSTSVFSGRNLVSTSVGFNTGQHPQSIYTSDSKVDLVKAGATIRFKDCNIRDSVTRTNFYTVTFASDNTYPYGETLGVDYAHLLVDNLDYEYLRDIGPELDTDSTHGFIVPGSQHFVVTMSSIPGITKKFNNCTFSAPNMYSFSSDSTVHLFNKYSFSRVAKNTCESILEQYPDFPALVFINGYQGGVYANQKVQDKLIEFNNSKFVVTGKNHPQKGSDTLSPTAQSGPPFMDATEYASEFCVGLSDTGLGEIYFNDCYFENLFDSPYSGLILSGANYAVNDAYPVIGSVRLNNCHGRSSGYSFLSVNNGEADVNIGYALRINDSEFMSYKAPIVKTSVRPDNTNTAYYSPMKVYAQNSTFVFNPYLRHISSVTQNNRNIAPLWVDSTTHGGLFEFDTTGDVGVFYNCHFNTPPFDYGFIESNFLYWGLDDDFYSNMTGNYKFGSFVCFYQDSTEWLDERFQFMDCKFTSPFLPPFRHNVNFSNDTVAPAIVHGCKIYSDTTIAESMDINLLYHDSEAADNLLSQHIKFNLTGTHRTSY